MAETPEKHPKDRIAQMEKRQARLKDGEGRTPEDLDQLAQVGELTSGAQPDEVGQGDPLKKKPANE